MTEHLLDRLHGRAVIGQLEQRCRGQLSFDDEWVMGHEASHAEPIAGEDPFAPGRAAGSE